MGGPFGEAWLCGAVPQVAGARRFAVDRRRARYPAGPGGVLSDTGGQLGGEGIADLNQFGFERQSKRSRSPGLRPCSWPK